MSLKNYVAKEPRPRLLTEGVHQVSLLSWLEVNSFLAIKDGKIAGPKTKVFPWINPIDELYVVVGNADGVAGYRHNLSGCPRFTELSDRQLATGKFVDKNGYACEITDAGIVRLEDPDRTAKCESILDSILWACGANTGESASNVLDRAIALKIQFRVTVIKEVYRENDDEEGTAQLRLSKFERIDVKAEQPTDIDV